MVGSTFLFAFMIFWPISKAVRNLFTKSTDLVNGSFSGPFNETVVVEIKSLIIVAEVVVLEGAVVESLAVDVVLVVGGMVAVSVLLGIFVVVVDFVGVAEGVVDVELVTTPDVSCDELTAVAVVLVIVGATIGVVVGITFGTSFVLGTVVLCLILATGRIFVVVVDGGRVVIFVV